MITTRTTTTTPLLLQLQRAEEETETQAPQAEVVEEKSESSAGVSNTTTSCFKFINDDMVYAILDKNPTLRDDVNVWKSIISTFETSRQRENRTQLLLNTPTDNINTNDTDGNNDDNDDDTDDNDDDHHGGYRRRRRDAESTYCSLKYAPSSILRNRQLMISACSYAVREL